MSTPAAGQGAVIEVKGLTKRFGTVVAAQGLDFAVQPGRVTGFLGPNGAGKTTTLRMMLGLVTPTAGTATIGGRRYRDLATPVRQVGAVLEATGFHPARRARSHLAMMAMAAGLEPTRIDAVLELVGLTGDGRRRVGEFSTGMRQRLELAGALLGDPGVLILDEPSNGLDPQGIAWLREFLRHLASQGRTVLVSSHLLAEMAQTVDDVVILSGGTVRAQGPLSSLMARSRSSMRVRTPEPDRLGAVVAQAGLIPRRLGPDVMVVDDATPEKLGPVLAANRIVVYELVQETQDLEHLFFGLTTPYGGSPAGWAPPAGPATPGPPPQGPVPPGPVSSGPATGPATGVSPPPPGPPLGPPPTPPPPPRWTPS